MGGRVDATWRLGRVASHLQAASAVEEPAPPSPYEGGFIVTSLLEPPPPPPPLAAAEPPAPGLDDEQLAGYVARGFINLPRELIGLDPDHHRRVHAHHKAARLANGTAGHPYASWKGDNIFNHMSANPGVLEVINSPALVAAVGSILGPDWAIVPYANSVIEADAGDQHWHKDDIFPWNARKPGLRQHHLEHLNLFYYPQDVTELMGPTAMIPYSHYWTVDHDENNANICIEMLHPISMHSDPDLAQRDARLNGAVHDTGWPLVRQVQTCARGGSVTLMSQNVFHRRNRRRDSPEEIEANPRYMWRFMCYRTTEPLATAAAAAASECGSECDGAAVHGEPESRADQLLETWVVNGGSDEMTGAVLARGGEAEPLCSVWASVLGWARGEPAAVGSVSPSMSEAAAVAALAADLRSKGAEHEPARIDAAYRLGALCNATFTDCSGLFAAALPTQAATAAVASLADAMSHSWEGVRRAATHGLISAGGHCTAAEEALLALCVRRRLLPTPPCHHTYTHAHTHARACPHMLLAEHLDDCCWIHRTRATPPSTCGRTPPLLSARWRSRTRTSSRRWWRYSAAMTPSTSGPPLPPQSVRTPPHSTQPDPCAR